MATIRYSADDAICMVDDDGEFRAATQEEMGTLPLGPDLTPEEIATLAD